QIYSFKKRIFWAYPNKKASWQRRLLVKTIVELVRKYFFIYLYVGRNFIVGDRTLWCILLVGKGITLVVFLVVRISSTDLGCCSVDIYSTNRFCQQVGFGIDIIIAGICTFYYFQFIGIFIVYFFNTHKFYY